MAYTGTFWGIVSKWRFHQILKAHPWVDLHTYQEGYLQQYTL